MGFYIELHCDTPECPHGGNEEGIQGNNRGSVKRDARAAGWLCVDGCWYCDGCVADRGWNAPTREMKSKFSRKIAKAAGHTVSAFVVAASGMEARQGRDAAERLDGEAATARPDAQEQPLEPKD